MEKQEMKEDSLEIGSIYELNPERVKSAAADCSMPKLYETRKYGKKNICYTASGREAISLAVRALETARPGIRKSCLLPAYMCDTVFRPFTQAGWKLHFYHVDETLCADGDGLEADLKKYGPGLLFIHPYYGVDSCAALRSVLAEWRSRGLCVMEDVTQSYYLDGAGDGADFVVGSLRKWYPVTDGGFAASDCPMPAGGLLQQPDFTEARRRLLTEKWDYLYGPGEGPEKALRKERYLNENRRLEEALDAVEGIHTLSALSSGLLAQENEETARRAREENCRILADGLAGRKCLSFVNVTPGMRAAPLYFPVYARERICLQRWLRLHDIYAPFLWPVGKDNEPFLSDTDKYIFGHLVALPLDQRYGRREMEKIVETVKEYDDRNQNGYE